MQREIVEVETKIRNLDLSYTRLDEFWWAMAEGARFVNRSAVARVNLAPEEMNNVISSILEEFKLIVELDAGRPWRCWLSTLIEALRRPTSYQSLFDLVASVQGHIGQAMRIDEVQKLAAEDRLRDLHSGAIRALVGAANISMVIRGITASGN